MIKPDSDLLSKQAPAWWYVGILLAMFFILMVSHIAVLWVGVAKCNQYTDLRLKRFEVMQERMATNIPAPEEIKISPICAGLAQEFNGVAQLYMATILALLSGAGFSAGAQNKNAHTKPPRRSDTP